MAADSQPSPEVGTKDAVSIGPLQRSFVYTLLLAVHGLREEKETLIFDDDWVTAVLIMLPTFLRHDNVSSPAVA